MIKKRIFIVLLVVLAGLAGFMVGSPSKVEATDPTDYTAVRPRFVWSPDGQWLAYFCFKDEVRPLRLCISDETFSVTYYSPDEALLSSAPSWSPNSTRIAFGCFHTDQPNNLLPSYRRRLCVSDRVFEGTKYSSAVYYGILFD